MTSMFPRVALFTLLVTVFPVMPTLAQTAAPATAPSLSLEEMETFLLNGRIVSRRERSKGVTDAYRVTLSDGRTTHDAQVQNVDIARAIFDVDPKHTELNFKDTYRYNIAGYRLARLLGLKNVPVSVPRNVDGKPAAMTWWIDDVAFDESGRVKAKATTKGKRAMRSSSLSVSQNEIAGLVR